MEPLETLVLYKQEADIELGALSLTNFVLTLDKKDGPLKSVSENGGQVTFLNEICTTLGAEALSLRSRLLKVKHNKAIKRMVFKLHFYRSLVLILRKNCNLETVA